MGVLPTVTMPATLSCPRCGGDLGPGDRFCAQCGAELGACSACGMLLLEADHSCPKCGAPVTPTAESDTISYQDADAGSPWAEVVVRLRRATPATKFRSHCLGVEARVLTCTCSFCSLS